jgi:hypothetical protein
MALIFASGLSLTISRRSNSTAHILQPAKELVLWKMVGKWQTSYLHLPWVARFDCLETAKLVFKGWTVPHYAEGMEHLWDAVVFDQVTRDA